MHAVCHVIIGTPKGQNVVLHVLLWHISTHSAKRNKNAFRLLCRTDKQLLYHVDFQQDR